MKSPATSTAESSPESVAHRRLASQKGIPGCANKESTAAFASFCQQNLGIHDSSYRRLHAIDVGMELTISSIGVGTYQGDIGPEPDKLVVSAIVEAVRGGINVIDTAVNYRLQQGERCVGQALKTLLDPASKDSHITREALFISTKAGFVPGDYAKSEDKETGQKEVAAELIAAGVPAEDICKGYMHTLHPLALDILLAKSLENLGLETVDLLYLHNAENQKGMGVSHELLMQRIAKAFIWCEEMIELGKIRAYGLATWDCFRVDSCENAYLSLFELYDLARDASVKVHGPTARCGLYMQIPVNVGKLEALRNPTQKIKINPDMPVTRLVPSLDYCRRAAGQKIQTGFQGCCIPVFTSSSLGGGGELPAAALEVCNSHPAFEGLPLGPSRLLEFARSCPGVCCSLVGMKSPANVAQNLALMKKAPIPTTEFVSLEAALSSALSLEAALSFNSELKCCSFPEKELVC